MTFDELKRADYANPTVALFYGTNCGPCEHLKPKLKRLCQASGVRLEQFNSSAEMDAVRALGLRSVPTAVVVFKGKVKVAFSGNLSEADIKTQLSGAGVRLQ